MEAVIKALGLNSTILAQILNFIVLLVFIRLVIYKPINGLLEKRPTANVEKMKAAEEDRRGAEGLRQS